MASEEGLPLRNSWWVSARQLETKGWMSSQIVITVGKTALAANLSKVEECFPKQSFIAGKQPRERDRTCLSVAFLPKSFLRKGQAAGSSPRWGRLLKGKERQKAKPSGAQGPGSRVL
jgi:hypothetical protein